MENKNSKINKSLMKLNNLFDILLKNKYDNVVFIKSFHSDNLINI